MGNAQGKVERAAVQRGAVQRGAVRANVDLDANVHPNAVSGNAYFYNNIATDPIVSVGALLLAAWVVWVNSGRIMGPDDHWLIITIISLILAFFCRHQIFDFCHQHPMTPILCTGMVIAYLCRSPLWEFTYHTTWKIYDLASVVASKFIDLFPLLSNLILAMLNFTKNYLIPILELCLVCIWSIFLASAAKDICKDSRVLKRIKWLRFSVGNLVYIVLCYDIFLKINLLLA